MAITKNCNNKIPTNSTIFNLIIIVSCFIVSIRSQITVITPGTTLQFQDQLVSPQKTFTLGFYRNPGSSLDYWYLAIRYTDGYAQSVWVGNRNNPLKDIKGNFALDATGILKITESDGSEIVINSASAASKNSRAILTDSGNFVLEELSSDGSTVVRILWQSFDYPVDTLLPGMKLGINFTTGRKWSLSSWLSPEAAAAGAFTLEWDWKELQLVVKRRDEMYWTSGKLDTQTNVFPNITWMTQDFHPNDYDFNYVSNEDSSYFYYSVSPNRVSWLNLRYDGTLFDTNKIHFLISDACYGYIPNEVVYGCVEQKADICREGKGAGGAVDQFSPVRGNFRTPPDYDLNASLGISDCWATCWNNCSCIAYDDLSANGTGCRFWGTGSVFNSLSSSEEIYVLKSAIDKGTSGNRWWIWVIIALVGAVVALVLAWLCYIRRRKHKEELEKQEEEILLELTTSKRFGDSTEIAEGNKGRDVKLFSFAAIVGATNNFSSENKLGQGGFGPVYKGELPDGRKIAVKRLSKGSGQGLIEFKNEIVLIAKLQHTNLVRLFGCCIQGDDEKMLIYEYMPNKSLDYFLFDPAKKDVLNWTKRYEIIEGIAQGLLYLHKYSRFKIIHRDLKVSNILLDDQMNPKIADFGLARIFGRDAKEETTKRVVGTYGYMSPEYAMEGIFSERSDVYSFGVLMLEIVSGRKNNSFYQYDRPMTIVSYARQQWREQNVMEMVDSSLSSDSTVFANQIIRCIHVSLLCVQEKVSDRPTMSDVISMLGNETMPIPSPNEPVSISQSNASEVDTSDHDSRIYSRNDVTLTVMEPR